MAISATHSAHAQPAAAASVPFTIATGDCPDRAAVEREVLRLIPPERHELLREGVRVELADLGESYRVTVTKDGVQAKKSYADPARDCEGRARFAAVFAVLTIMPPELGLTMPDTPEVPEAPPPPAPPPPAAPAVVAPSASEPSGVARIELGTLVEYAPPILRAPGLALIGGELRVVLGSGVVQGTLSGAYMSHAKFELRGVRGELQHFPSSLGLRFRSDFGSWSVSPELGLLVMLQRVRGTDLFETHSRSALEFGTRVGLTLERDLGAGFATFLGASASVIPVPQNIVAAPQGALGNLPYLWLGGSLGVSLGI